MSLKRPTMRIVLVIGTAAPGGAEGQLIQLAASLKERGHVVSVLFLVAGGPLTRRLDEAGVQWRVLPVFSPATRRARKLWELTRFARNLHRSRADVVYAWLPGVIWLTLPIAALTTRAVRMAAFRGLTLEPEIRGRLRRHTFRCSVRSAHAVTANAPWLRDEAIGWGAADDRVHFIPNGVTLPPMTATTSTEPPRAVVLANFHEYKAQHRVITVMRDVPTLRVKFIGSGITLQENQELAVQIGVHERTTFIEDCHEVSAELLECQFAIHPSLTEGMSNAILEEIAHGLPVVATNVGAAELLIDHGVTGYLVDVDDAESMLDRVRHLSASSDVRTTMGRAARVKAESFSWELSVDRHEALIAELHKSHGRRR